MSDALDALAHLARLSEDALRDATAEASPDDSDSFIDRASERASQVEQLRALDRPQGATAAALPPVPHAMSSVDETERALKEACSHLLASDALDDEARTLVAQIAATCR